MSLIGLQIFLTLKFNFLIPKKNISIFALLIGICIPEIDIFFKFYNFQILFERNITHSIISIILIYLMFLIFYELKKNNEILRVGKGFSIGMIINILIDIFIRLGDLDIFWPLPIGMINKIPYSTEIFNVFLCLELIFFRLTYSKLINTIIDIELNDPFIKYLTHWMKIQGWLIIIFIIAILLTEYLTILFIWIYIPSYIMTLLSIVKLRSNFKS